MINKVKVNRGDIYFVTLTGNGSVQSGLRPVVVISNNVNNLHSSVITVVPCTTKLKKLPVHVDLSNECGLKRKTQAMCEQVVTIEKNSLVDFAGKVTQQDMKKIEQAMLIQLGFGGGFGLPQVFSIYILKIKLFSAPNLTQSFISYINTSFSPIITKKPK